MAGSAPKKGRHYVHPKGTPMCPICGFRNTKFGQFSLLGVGVPLGCTWGENFFGAWGHPPTLYVCQISLANSSWSRRYALSKIGHPVYG